MRILICGEGRNDHGTRFWDSRLKRYANQDGWAQPLLRQLLGEWEDLVIDRVERRSLVQFRRPRRRRPRGHAEKAKLALHKAEREGYQILIFIADADSPTPSEWRRRNSEIVSAWPGDSKSRPIACLPMSASESWLLADSEAWEETGLADLTKLPPSPERIWGERNDPTGNHPHQFFARICAEVGLPDNTETRAVVASAISPNALSGKCPVSFPPFRNAIEAVRAAGQP